MTAQRPNAPFGDRQHRTQTPNKPNCGPALKAPARNLRNSKHNQLKTEAAKTRPLLSVSKKWRSHFFERASLRSAPRLSAVSGQFDARFVQSVFVRRTRRRKKRFHFIRGVRAANSARLFRQSEQRPQNAASVFFTKLHLCRGHKCAVPSSTENKHFLLKNSISVKPFPATSWPRPPSGSRRCSLRRRGCPPCRSLRRPWRRSCRY